MFIEDSLQFTVYTIGLYHIQIQSWWCVLHTAQPGVNLNLFELFAQLMTKHLLWILCYKKRNVNIPVTHVENENVNLMIPWAWWYKLCFKQTNKQTRNCKRSLLFKLQIALYIAISTLATWVMRVPNPYTPTIPVTLVVENGNTLFDHNGFVQNSLRTKENYRNHYFAFNKQHTNCRHY